MAGNCWQVLRSSLEFWTSKSSVVKNYGPTGLVILLKILENYFNLEIKML